ncbi:hypothetical protein FOA52_001440 [Chlamydomonas sp. UWO 241]|nr:hypothetical protein FOA52_001440 [Chlamydomonas sp. UWO 241]
MVQSFCEGSVTRVGSWLERSWRRMVPPHGAGGGAPPLPPPLPQQQQQLLLLQEQEQEQNQSTEECVKAAAMRHGHAPPSTSNAAAGKQSPAAQAKEQRPPPSHQRQRSTAVCGICFDEHAQGDMVYAGSDAPGSSSTAPGCGHRFCIDCMGQYVCTCVDSNKYPVQCPIPGCSETLAHQDNFRLLLDSPAQLERFTRLEVESAIHPSERLYCPHKNCSTLLMTPAKKSLAGQTTCPACKQTIYANCLIPGWHEGFSCEAFQALPPHLRSAKDAALLNLSATLRWMKCPSCSHVVERIDGCNHNHQS